MTLASRLAAIWFKIGTFLEALDQAAVYDPIETQRRWIVALGECIANLEAGVRDPADRAGGSLPDT